MRWDTYIHDIHMMMSLLYVVDISHIVSVLVAERQTCKFIKYMTSKWSNYVIRTLNSRRLNK